MSKPKKGKRFVYQLQTLLNVRDIREKQEQDEFKKKEKELHEERDKEKEIQRRQEAHLDEVNEMLSSDELPGLTMIQMHQQHVKRLEEEREKQKEEVKKAEDRRDEQREKLIQASKEKRIMEKDKDKTRTAWKKMMDKLDSQFLDEISSIKSATNMIKRDSEAAEAAAAAARKEEEEGE